MKPSVPGPLARAVEAEIELRARARTARIEGPCLEVFFPSTDKRDVAHLLGVTPTGYVLILERGGHVAAVDVEKWSPDLAWLQASAAGVRVRLYFIVTEVPLAT